MNPHLSSIALKDAFPFSVSNFCFLDSEATK
jgi:hypothetical protein